MSYIEKECEQHHEYCMSQQCNTVEVRLAPNWTVFLPAQYWLTTMNPYTILLSMSINDPMSYLLTLSNASTQGGMKNKEIRMEMGARREGERWMWRILILKQYG